MSSLWQRSDETLLAALVAALGSAGSYTTLLLRHSALSEVWQPEAWKKPALILYSRDVRQVAQEHGGGTTHVTSRYRYALALVSEGDSYTEARQAAQELLRRALLVLRNWPSLVATIRAADPTDAEQPLLLRWDGASLRVEPRAGRTNSSSGQHWGEAALLFEIEAKQ